MALDFTLDAGPGPGGRIGLLTLATDQVIEDDMRRMLPDDVALYVTRIHSQNPCTLENLAVLSRDITESVSLLLPGGSLDVIAFACTSGSIVLGSENIFARIHKARPGIACVTPMTAVLAALRELNVKRIVLLTPYLAEINRAFENFFLENEIDVVALKSFEIASDVDMARLPVQTIQRLAEQADCKAAEALFLPCTGWRSCAAIDALEAHLGKPVLTSNQLLLWQSLRLIGYSTPVLSYGKLLREKLC